VNKQTLLTNGRLYVFEGADGVGKSTIIKSVAARLKDSVGILSLSFPGQESGSLGKLVYDIHHTSSDFGIKKIDPLSLQVLHVAAHIDCIQKQIKPALDQGKTVLLDRFWWSMMAYGESAGIPCSILQHLRELEGKIWDVIKPIQLFYIQTQASFRPELSPSKWKKVTAIYAKLVTSESDNYPITIIKNNGTIKQATDKIYDIVMSSHQLLVDSEKPLFLEFDQHGDQPAPQKRKTKRNPWAPAKTTAVYETYWAFAAERQSIFFKRLRGDNPPWTSDPIIQAHKFTNAYRASDRVSQYLIKNVIYDGDQTPSEVFFRIILFKIFNKIETWEMLKNALGSITYTDFSFDPYDKILTKALKQNIRIYSAAYIMPSGGKTLGHKIKHRNNLELLSMMMRGDLPNRICDSNSMQEVFELLRSYPTIGDFLAYQYATDLNYSEITNFSEMSFVIPGPGAKDGIRKCFSDYGGLTEVNLITSVAERQQEEFERLGIKFQGLWGRPLQLIDCQNLFCEVDKYSRVAHPTIKGITGRMKIKQKYHLTPEPINYFYPPKWDINDQVMNMVKMKTV